MVDSGVFQLILSPKKGKPRTVGRKPGMNPTFTLIFSFVLICLYILGIVLYSSNRAPWRKIIVNEFLVFGILGFLGLWIVIHFSLR
jgi:hypothetical protein